MFVLSWGGSYCCVVLLGFARVFLFNLSRDELAAQIQEESKRLEETR